mmetsp:Transcript_37942/g.100361  ORF Transcript_37942/g.100361 Transcript_37942/m.100361 type:complete len:200 (+) Transcript_37942:258-857(+)
MHGMLDLLPIRPGSLDAAPGGRPHAAVAQRAVLVPRLRRRLEDAVVHLVRLDGRMVVLHGVVVDHPLTDLQILAAVGVELSDRPPARNDPVELQIVDQEEDPDDDDGDNHHRLVHPQVILRRARADGGDADLPRAPRVPGRGHGEPRGLHRGWRRTSGGPAPQAPVAGGSRSRPRRPVAGRRRRPSGHRRPGAHRASVA